MCLFICCNLSNSIKEIKTKKKAVLKQHVFQRVNRRTRLIERTMKSHETYFLFQLKLQNKITIVLAERDAFNFGINQALNVTSHHHDLLIHHALMQYRYPRSYAK